MSIESNLWSEVNFDLKKHITMAVNQVMLHTKSCVTLSVFFLLADDNKLRILNEQYCHKDEPTNVLAFPYSDVNMLPYLYPNNQNESEPRNVANACESITNNTSFVCGDVAISYERISEESVEYECSFEEHFILIVIHGVLHLLGYTHDDDEHASIMERLEHNIMCSLGYYNR
ncbi:MAG: rRNA maturation RNase YbeY [Proteobacteria bacterium]|nr:rRNA maturation RNase YbeY [Pseudomonadota bacterium]